MPAKGTSPRAFDEKVAAQGGDEVILRRVASGEQITRIAKSYKVSTDTLRRWAERGGEERQIAWQCALAASADAHLDKAQNILEEARDVESAAQATIAGRLSDFHRWMAQTRNRQEYGDRNGVNLNFNIGQMHLSALRQGGGALIPGDRPVLSAEIVED